MPSGIGPKNLPTVQFEVPLLDQLSTREQAFVQHPEVFIDPVKAAVEVGYSPTTARSKAHTMRKQLMYFIKPLHDARVQEAGVTVEWLIYQLKCIAAAQEPDYYDTVDVEGDTIKALKDPTRLPEHMKIAIKSISYETVILPDGSSFQRAEKIELHDKLAALRELKSIIGADDPAFSKPQPVDDQELMENLEPEELEIVSKIYAKAEARAKNLASKKRDQRAITVDGKK